MHNPLSAGRRLALRAIVWQAGATVLVALASLAFGVQHALAALVGGGAVVAGNVAAAYMALGGGVQPAGMAMGRLLAGIMLKWLVAFALLGFGLAGLGLPPLPMLAGLLAVTLAYVLANLLQR